MFWDTCCCWRNKKSATLEMASTANGISGNGSHNFTQISELNTPSPNKHESLRNTPSLELPPSRRERTFTGSSFRSIRSELSFKSVVSSTGEGGDFHSVIGSEVGSEFSFKSN